jgi:hypothetical protein
MRDGFSDWADSQSSANSSNLPESVVAQALRIPVFSRGTAAGGGGSGASGRQSAPRRDARTYAGVAGRAAEIARALREGDREALERQGLDLDKLSAMPTRAEMVRAIVEVVCEAQPGSDIPSEEQRAIAGKLADWMLDPVMNQDMPDAAATAEHAIGLLAAEIFLSESGDELTARNGQTREDLIEQINEASQRLASKAGVANGATDADSITKAIEKGIRSLRRIYKAEKPS